MFNELKPYAYISRLQVAIQEETNEQRRNWLQSKADYQRSLMIQLLAENNLPFPPKAETRTLVYLHGWTISTLLDAGLLDRRFGNSLLSQKTTIKVNL